jgi:hypothetical protein
MPEASSRRHTDPPFLWISVFVGSICLHLLGFWLVRSSNEINPWFPQSRQGAMPIDLIEVAPPTKAIATAVKAKPAVKTSVAPKVVTQPTNPDDEAINAGVNLPREENTPTRKVATQPKPEPREIENQPEPEPTPTLTPTPTPLVSASATPEPTPTPKPLPTLSPAPIFTPDVPVGDLPWQRRQEIKLGRGTRLPNDIPVDEPTPTGEASPTPETETSPSPSSEASPTPEMDASPSPNSEASPTPAADTSPSPSSEASPTPETDTSPSPSSDDAPKSNTGGAVATVFPIAKDEVKQLIQQKRLIADALPDVLAEYKGSSTKELDLSFLVSDFGLKPAELLASLVIDKNGNFQQAVVLEIAPAALRSQKSIYEQALIEVFKQESFVGAYNQDGSQPELSNLYVRITIQSTNSP